MAAVSARVHEIEHAIEETLAETLHSAERSIATRFGHGALRAIRTLLRAAAWLLVALFFAFGGLILAARYWLLPSIDQHRPRIEALAGELLGSPVSIGRIDAAWRGLNPNLALNDVRIGADGGSQLALPRVEATLSWGSVLRQQPRFTRLRAHTPEVDIALRADGTIAIAGMVVDPATRSDTHPGLDWLLDQGEVTITDARVNLRDERAAAVRAITFNDLDLTLVRGWGSHRLGINAAPPPDLAAPFELRGRFTHSPFERVTDFTLWSGEVFAQFDFVDLAQLNSWLRLPVETRRAQGALRGWLNFERTELVRVVADLALKDVDVRLARDLEPMQLESLQGRLSQRRWGNAFAGGEEFGTTRLSYRAVDGAVLPPLDLNARITRRQGDTPVRTQIKANQIDLAALTYLAAHVPLAEELRALAGRLALRGSLSSVDMSWDGSQPQLDSLTLSTQFSGLAGTPPADGPSAGRWPQFENLSGAIELNGGAGRLQLASRDVRLHLPAVFADALLELAHLNATLHWKNAPQLEVSVDALNVANADLEFSASGVWQAAQPSARADFSGRIVRLELARAHRYLPLAVGAGTRSWLEGALLAGRGQEGTLRLRGALDRFPFTTPADGEFRAALRVRDAALDFVPTPAADGSRQPGTPWPLLTGLEAELVFERNAMTITADRGRLQGARLEKAVARIPELGRGAQLNVQGQVSGPLSEMLSYVNASPVAGMIGGFTRGVEARGTARLDLQLGIPLAQGGATRVSGALQLAGNDLILAGVPPFARLNGTLNFTERGVRFNNIAAAFLGGNARLDAQTRADGASVISVAGTMSPNGLRRITDSGIVDRILDRAQGSARYSGSFTVQPGATTLIAESDLVGLAIDGIAPLRKSAAEPLPLRFERATRGADREDLTLTAGKLLGLRFERRREQTAWSTVRGVIAVNEPANLPESGLLLNVSVPRLDLEAWNAWLAGGPAAESAGPAGDGPRLDYVALRTPELIFQRRMFHGVTLGASRVADGGFDINLVSDGIVGYIGWRPGGGEGGAHGRINAKLSRLSIPAARKEDVVDVLRAPTRQVPSIDVSAENFELGNARLGRLELVAQNTGTGNNAVWRLRRLDITNPDMKLAASGEWVPAGSGTRRMQLKFSLDANDAGATLTRLGYPQTMARGQGQLTGDVDWFGSPLDIDFATLSGKLQLAIDNGRFLRVETGNAARLLGLLSLQSLSRFLTTDARDSFGEGFAFTSIRADATIARGVLSTQNFRMAGTSAAALMSGSIDLRNETQQLHLVVLPEIDASTAALALTVVNPIVGIGTFLAQTVLRDPLSRAFALEYDITGTWTDPVLTRRGRATATPEANR